MPFLLVQILSILSLISPIAGCTKANDVPATVYTVAQHRDPDSANRNISTSRHNAITDAVAKASPAVVGINVTEVIEQRIVDPFADFFNQMDPSMRQFFGNMGHGGGVRKYQVKGLGSGFIISKDGFILTNDHVAGNAAKIIVTTTDGAQYDAKLVGTDRNADVALLKIDGKNLPFLQLGNSDDLSVGEWAIAMGNPFGLFDINDKPTVTVGVISNTGVNLGLEDGRNYRGMVQTDAAISSGNSGGPLLNANGDVIGINAVIRSTAQSQQGAGSIGLGFAIPITKVIPIVDQLRSGQKVDRNIGDVGFRVAPLTDESKQYFNISGDEGVVVTDLRRGSIGERSGLQVGDLITKVGTDRVRTPTELESILADHKVGDVLDVKVRRGDEMTTVKLRLVK